VGGGWGKGKSIWVGLGGVVLRGEGHGGGGVARTLKSEVYTVLQAQVDIVNGAIQIIRPFVQFVHSLVHVRLAYVPQCGIGSPQGV
jgi:hypothetical protein